MIEIPQESEFTFGGNIDNGFGIQLVQDRKFQVCH